MSINFGPMFTAKPTTRSATRRPEEPRPTPRKGTSASVVARARGDDSSLFVHASGALTDRTDRDGKARRQKEVCECLPLSEPVAGVSKAKTPNLDVPFLARRRLIKAQCFVQGTLSGPII